MTASLPPIAGMTVERWAWLRDTPVVRPHVIARVRAALAAGVRATPDQVALAIINGPERDVA